MKQPNENIYTYGSPEGQIVKVYLESAKDPSKVFDGMEEYIYKQAQIINYGKKKSPNVYLHQAICSSPRHSMLAKIFENNVQ